MLLGCSTASRFEEAITPWIGSDIESLVRAWGDSDTRIVLPDGNFEYSYNVTKRYGSKLPDACVVFFVVDKNTKRILSFHHEGARCKRAPSFV